MCYISSSDTKQYSALVLNTIGNVFHLTVKEYLINSISFQLTAAL